MVKEVRDGLVRDGFNSYNGSLTLIPHRAQDDERATIHFHDQYTSGYDTDSADQGFCGNWLTGE